MNPIQVLVGFILIASLVYVIWFTPALDKLVNTFKKKQNNLIKENVNQIEKITTNRLNDLITEKKSLEADVDSFIEIVERITKTPQTPKRAKTKKTTNKE